MLSGFFDPYDPPFTPKLKAELLATVTRRLGYAPSADQLAAYCIYLNTVAEMLLDQVDRELQRRAKEKFQTSSHRGSAKEAMGIEPENGALESDLDDEVIGCA